MITTCMLICYNPRDTVTDLLSKTGIVMHSNRTGKDGKAKKKATPRASMAQTARKSRTRPPRRERRGCWGSRGAFDVWVRCGMP